MVTWPESLEGRIPVKLLNWDTFGHQADMTGDRSLVGFVYHHKYGLISEAAVMHFPGA